VRKKSGTLYAMELEHFNPIQEQQEVILAAPPHKLTSLPKFSFIPPELLKKTDGPRERCAFIGMILGAVAMISWIVILFGVVYSLAGITLSIIGLRSLRQKWARTGLIFSIIGLILSVWYIFAAYQGMINYNYFTSEFWSR